MMQWEQIDNFTERMADKTQKEIAGYYANALEDVTSELAEMSRKGLLTKNDMLQYGRLARVEEEIIQQIGNITKLSETELDNLLSKAYEETYYRTGYRMERELRQKLAFQKLNPDLVNQVVKNPMDRIGWIQRLEANQALVTRQLKSELFSGLTQGLGYEDIANRIKERMDVGATNMNRIVRTEAHRCREQGKLDSMKHAENKGMVAKKQWLSTKDKRTRDTHGSADGQKVDITEDFQVGGFFAKGPGMSGIAKEDINCRCTMITVIEGFEPKDQRIKGLGVQKDKTYKEWKDSLTNAQMYPDNIAGVKRGNPMSIEEARGDYKVDDVADAPSANPKYWQDRGHRVNCQTSVVAHEARHRGYKVIAKGNSKGSKLEKLSMDTTLAWVDPKTKLKPTLEKLVDATTPKKTYKALSKRLVEGERYTMEWGWKRTRSGHIVHVGKENGKVFLFDPQSGNLITDQASLELYFSDFRFTRSFYGMKDKTPPEILRVDDKEFSMDMVNDILEKGGN